MTHWNSFYKRLRHALASKGFDPNTPMAGWKFEAAEGDPTQGKLYIWVTREGEPIVVDQTGVNPDEGTGPGLIR